MPEVIATWDRFDGGHWGNRGPLKAEPNQWGGKNLITTEQGDLAPMAVPRTISISNIINGTNWGMHWAWGIDGRMYYLTNTNTTTAVVFAFSPSTTTTVTQAQIGKITANPSVSPGWVQASSTIYMTVYGYSTVAINAVAGTLAGLTGSYGAAPAGRAICIYGERLVIGATTGARFSTVPNRIVFSGDDTNNNPTDRTAWESLNYFDVGPPDARIAGLYPTRDSLTVVLEDQTIYQVTGTLGAGNQIIRRIYGFDRGTGAVTAFRGSHGAVDPSQTRVWMFDHNFRAPARFNGASYQPVTGIGGPQADRTAAGWIRGQLSTIGRADEVAVFGTVLSAESGAYISDPTTQYKRFVHVRINGAWHVVDQSDLGIGDVATGGIPGEYHVQGNNRYQLVICFNIGDGATSPGFYIWYANAPGWGYTVAGDVEFPQYQGDGVSAIDAQLSLPYRHVKPNQELQVDGVLVDFIPIAPNFTNQTSTMATGFTGKAYGYGVPSYSRTTTSPATSGLAISSAIAYASTINTGTQPSEVNSGAWPDVKTVYLPVRLGQHVRSVHVELSSIRGCRIVCVQVLGKQIQGRTT